jgi:hypothetical protein
VFNQDTHDWDICFSTITPDQAKDMLAIEVRNRPIRQHSVNAYADDMRNGRWLFTPEPIIVDRNGGVLDGQHRLQAVVDTGTERPFLVISNVDPALIDVLGIGKRRSAADILRINGERSTERLAGAARALHNYLTIPPTYVWGGDNITLSPPGVLEVLRQHPGLRECVEVGSHIASHTLASPSAIIAAVYLTTHERSLEDQDQWISSLTSGAGLELGSPALALRELFRSMKSRRAFTRIRPSDRMRAYFASYLHGWRLWADGKEARRLTIPKTVPRVGLPQTPEKNRGHKEVGTDEIPESPSDSRDQ